MAPPGAKPPNATPDVLLDAGVDHFLSGRMREAALAFQQVLALDPANEQARTYLRNMLRPTSADVTSTGSLRAETAWDDGPSFEAPATVAPPRSQATAPSAAPPRSQAPTPGPVVTAAPKSRAPTPAPAPSIFPKSAKAPPQTYTQVQTFLNEARAAAELGDFTSAVERCDRVLEIEPTSVTARALRDQAAATLIHMYESQIGGLAGIPEVIANPGEIIWLSLDSKAAFVLGQIDGQVSYDDLYSICGMSQLDTSRILAQLLEQKVIRTRLSGPGRR